MRPPEVFIEHDLVFQDKSGNWRHTGKDGVHRAGTFWMKPPEAAADFTPETAKAAADRRWEDRLIETGDAKEHEDGSLRWASGNSEQKWPGAIIHPPDNAEITQFDSDSGKAARQVQLYQAQVGAQRGYVTAIANAHGIDPTELSLEDAKALDIEGLYHDIFNEEDLAKSVKARAYLDKAMGLEKPSAPLVDQRQVKIEMSQPSMDILENSPAIRRVLRENKNDAENQRTSRPGVD